MMSTPPPDKDRFPYPSDTVVAIARDAAAVTEAVRSLDAAGISADRVDLLEGPDGAKRIDPEGAGHGAKGRHRRRVQDLWGSEASDAREYAEHLRAGGRLVAVSVRDRDEAQLAGGFLRGAGLSRVRYYGRFSVESL